MLKRAFDASVAAVSLIVLAPLLLVILLMVWLTLGHPAVFAQTRPGLGGRPFRLFKFRTMREIRRPDGEPLPDGARLTRFGRWLRATSLDELPELVNILRGEMSLVGPRPLLMEYLPLYSPEQARRHAVRPGLTGWAQVNGRNATTWEARFALDVWYVDHRSFWLDLRIVGRTMLTVLRREGIAHPDHATMDKFRGTPA
jgi:lipopolysaccharide/colanic/teichoic acid biosynthesis glycosyltransferase